jgi:dUTP pyrophosphatase
MEPITTDKLRVKLFHSDATLPERKSEHAAGYDLSSCEDTVIPARGHKAVNTGVGVELPGGCYGRVASRSGLAVDHGIVVGAGVIDPDYIGEIKAVLFNHNDEEFKVLKHQRIAQLILEEYRVVPVEQVTGELRQTTRGTNGFGSTDKRPKLMASGIGGGDITWQKLMASRIGGGDSTWHNE